MHSKLKGFLANAPLKLIAVIFFAIFTPSVLVTALGLVAVFQADAFVRDRFRTPILEKVDRLAGTIETDWGRRLDLYADCLKDLPDDLGYLRDLCRDDPCIRDVLVSGPSGLRRVEESHPRPLWPSGFETSLSVLNRLELVEKDDERALAECQRLLATVLDDTTLLEVQLAASRILYRLGEPERALEHLLSVRERFGNTMDATGAIRDIPLLWRIFEIQRELHRDSAARSTAVEIARSLRRHASRMRPEEVAGCESKLASLEDDFRPVTPLDDGLDAEAGWAERLRADPGLLAGLESVLPAGTEGPAEGRRVTHASVDGLGDLDVVSYRCGPEGPWVHLVLERAEFLAEVELEGDLVGLSEGRLRFFPRQGAGADSAEASRSVFSTSLPLPFDDLELTYIPRPGEIPGAFRGFNVLSITTFSWAVIVLVLTIVLGVLITVRSVLYEMRTARMKTDFVSFISHELKTPLTAVRMFTETILSGRVEDKEEERFCIEMIDKESERLSKLIDQILEYSRIQTKQKEFRFVSCDMMVVVEEAIRIFREHNPQDEREIEINAVQHISKIKMDRASMVELFLNLISNAAKYSPKGHSITVNMSESVDDISVQVVDKGVGIRKRDQKRIFEKFYRAEDYLTRDVEGTGLGLTFARYIAKVHNGDIKVSSQVDSGSSFTLQIRKTDVLAE